MGGGDFYFANKFIAQIMGIENTVCSLVNQQMSKYREDITIKVQFLQVQWHSKNSTKVLSTKRTLHTRNVLLSAVLLHSKIEVRSETTKNILMDA